MKLFLTSSAEHLRRSLRRKGLSIAGYETSAFADGEHRYRLSEDVKRESVAIVGSILPDPGSLFEIVALNCLALENGAKRTDLVVPYLGYARQDRPSQPGEGSIGIMVIELLQKLGASRLLLVDVHSQLLRKVFGPSVTELSCLPLIAEALSKRPPEVIVSPDAGFRERATRLASLLAPRPDIAFIDKVRPRPNVAVARRLHGDVQGKRAVIVDDMIDTGRTLVEAVKLVFQHGARSIRLAATHGIFSDNSRKHLSSFPVEKILITNTLPQVRYPKIQVLDISPLLVRGISPHPAAGGGR